MKSESFKATYDGDTFTSLLIISLFIKARKQNQSICSAADEQVKTIWCVYTTLFSCKGEWNDGTWREKDANWGQTRKSKCCMLYLIGSFQDCVCVWARRWQMYYDSGWRDLGEWRTCGNETNTIRMWYQVKQSPSFLLSLINKKIRIDSKRSSRNILIYFKRKTQWRENWEWRRKGKVAMLCELRMKVIHVPLLLGGSFREKVGTLKPLEKCT